MKLVILEKPKSFFTTMSSRVNKKKRFHTKNVTKATKSIVNKTVKIKLYPSFPLTFYNKTLKL